MIYGYIRVSTDKQTTENQRFEILKYADEKKLHIDRWIEETVSSTRKLSQRKLGALLTEMKKDDILLVSELSRLGRSLMEVMSILAQIEPFPALLQCLRRPRICRVNRCYFPELLGVTAIDSAYY